jgi:hypothetical protein
MGWGLRLHGLEFWNMGIVAMDAEEIGSLPGAVKITLPLSMNSRSPIPEDVAVTFTAEEITFSKVNQFSVVES